MQTSSILYLNWFWYLLASHSHRSDRSAGCIQWGHLGSPGSHKNTHRAIQSGMGKGSACSSPVWVLWVSLATQLDFVQRSASKGAFQMTSHNQVLASRLPLNSPAAEGAGGTSQFYGYFMAILWWNPVPWVSTSCSSIRSCKEQSRTTTNKKIQGIALGSPRKQWCQPFPGQAQ